MDVGEATGNDTVKIVEARIHVESDTVVGDPFAEGNTDGGDFMIPEPDAGMFIVAMGVGDAETATGPDDDLLEGPEVPMGVLFVRRQMEDGIGHELAGTVVRDVAAALGSN